MNLLSKSLLPLALFAGITAQVEARPLDITIASRHDDTTEYAEALLFLASRKSQRPIAITNMFERVESPNWRNALAKREVRIIWSAETEELNQRFKKIPIDIYQGIMGYRACVTHKDNEKKLGSITQAAQLKKFVFGSGNGWRDTEVLIKNGLEVITGSLDSLYEKAERKEIDCYSRAVFEVYSDDLDGSHSPHSRHSRHGMSLTAVNAFVLQYDNPFHFYVRKDDVALYTLVFDGLNKALHDGSFIETLQATRQYKDHVKHMRRDDLLIIEMR